MGPRTSPDSGYPLCSVCGSGGARYHYHGLVCQSCRVFFIRTVGQNKPLVCNRGGDCSTLLGNSCNACAACRFKKCLEAKMDCSAVGKKRKPSTCVNLMGVKNRAWMEQLHETLHPQTVSWFQNTSSNVVEIALHLIKLEYDINTLDNPTTSQYDENDYGITGMLRLGKNNGSRLKYKHDSKYYLRMADQYVDSLRFCPELKAMDTNDKSILLENCHEVFGHFTHKYYSWIAKKSQANSAFMAVSKPSSCQVRLETAEEIFEKHTLTDCEFVLLKIISLLSPSHSLSQEGHWYVVLARSRFITLLTNISRKLHPDLSVEHLSQRIAKLLQSIAKVQEEVIYMARSKPQSDNFSRAEQLSPKFKTFITL